jgi:phosphatidylethanolamine/phosphatidyl-N-methylethanolamine N-methyltransferase
MAKRPLLNDAMAFPLTGPLVFIRSVLRDPVGVGAVVPSSSRLSRLIASRVDRRGSVVLEVGAGTGSITDALLDRGIPAERLFLIERDPSLVSYLRDRFPGVRVRCGDAVNASAILSDEDVGQVHTVVSSLPIRNLNPRDQICTIREMFKALVPDGQLIQYTYSASCPIPVRRLGLNAECVGRVWMNLPPAAVWRFTRKMQTIAY